MDVLLEGNEYGASYEKQGIFFGGGGAYHRGGIAKGGTVIGNGLFRPRSVLVYAYILTVHFLSLQYINKQRVTEMCEQCVTVLFTFLIKKLI